MTTMMAFRLASVVTAIDVLVSCGFSIAAIIRPQVLVPAESVRTRASLLLAMYAAAPALFVACVFPRLVYSAIRTDMTAARVACAPRQSADREPFFANLLSSQFSS